MPSTARQQRRADRGRGERLPATEPEDGAEEHVDVRGAVRGARGARVDAEAEDAGAEDAGEDDADHDVVGAAAVAEQPERDRDQHSGAEQADPRVDADRERGERARERDVAQRVGAEHLAAQHDEVADESARGRDRGAGEERVAHERVREHLREAGAGGIGQHRRDHDAALTAPAYRRAPPYVTSAIAEIQNPTGYGE